MNITLASKGLHIKFAHICYHYVKCTIFQGDDIVSDNGKSKY